MKNRKGLLMMALGLLLILAALALVLYNNWESGTAGEASENALIALESARFDRKQNAPDPTNTPVPTAVPTATPAVTDAPTATPAVTDAPTATPVVTDAPTATPAVTDAPTATPAVTDAPTATPAAVAVSTEAPTATPAPTATVAPVIETATPIPTATLVPAPTMTAWPLVKVTPVPTVTPEPTPIVTPEPLPIWERIPGYEMPAVEIDGLDYVGTLTIPALDLKLPVQQTWDYKLLKTSPCVFSGTCYGNGFVIIAHRYNTHFASLKDLRPGDTVTFTDMDGNVFRYRVVTTDTLKPNQLAELLDDRYAMSLMTCTYDGSKRVTVRLERRN